MFAEMLEAGKQYINNECNIFNTYFSDKNLIIIISKGQLNKLQ